MMDGDNLFAEQSRIAKAASVALAAYVLIASATYAIVDIFFYESDALYLVSSILVWGLGFVLLVQLMQASAPAGEAHRGGIGGYFGLSLISSFAIGFATLFFILPGIYLAMRWMPSFARLYHESEGVTDALGWSWEHTTPLQKSLLVAMIGPVALYLVFFALIVWQGFYYDGASDLTYNAVVIAMNLTASIAIAWFQLIGVAAYRLIQRAHSQPVEVLE